MSGESKVQRVIVVTGSSSGFGRMAANALARAGHVVYASMRETAGRNARVAAEVEAFAHEHDVDIRPLELDVASDASVEAAIATIVQDTGRIDVVVHNAGHLVYGPAESFTPEQLAEQFDVNVLSTQRVNRAALPRMRRQGEGWSSGCRRAAREVARRRTSPGTSRRRRRWMRWRSATPPNSHAGA